MTDLPQQVQMTPLHGDDRMWYIEQEEFKGKKWHHYYFFGWFTGKQPRFKKLLKDELKDNNYRVTEFKIEHKRNFFQGFLCLVTASLYCPQVIKFNGKLYKHVEKEKISSSELQMLNADELIE